MSVESEEPPSVDPRDQGSLNNDPTLESVPHNMGENGVGKHVGDPETEVTETQTHEEYETVSNGRRAKVQTSKSERTEFSHTVHRKVYGDQPEGNGLHGPEFQEFPKIRVVRDATGPSTRMGSGTKDPDGDAQKENVNHYVRPTEGAPVRVTSLRSKFPGATPPFVSGQMYEDMKREYEAEIARLRNYVPASQPVVNREASKEMLQRRVILLESDLRDAKHVSEMLSEDLQALRKQYEYMVTKNLQIENNKRSISEKLRELKTENRKLSRDLSEKNQLLERLREAYNREKKTQQILGEIEAEHTKLVHDYDVLRHSYHRKEQQMRDFFNERTSLIRKLDVLEYEKQQMEQRLCGKSKSSTQPEAFERTASAMTTADDENLTLVQGTLTNSQTAPPTDIGTNNDQNNPSMPPLSVETGDGVLVPEDNSTLSPKPSPTRTEQATTLDPTTEDDPLYVPDEFCRSTNVTKDGDSPDDETVEYPYAHPLSDLRMHPSKSWLRKKQYLRNLSAGEYSYISGVDRWPETHRRSTYRHRPRSALGGEVLSSPSGDRTIFRSPLPARCTTSHARPRSRACSSRSPERTHRSHRRRSHHHSPSSFYHDAIRREEIINLEHALSQLKREKRRVERELYSGKMPRSRTRAEELSDMITRIGVEIYGLQSRLAVLKNMQ